MAYTFDKKSGEIRISGWEAGIAPSPHVGNGAQGPSGVADLKNVNISSVRGEVSVSYSRVRQDQAAIVSATGTINGVTADVGYAGSINAGTWIKILSISGGASNITVNNYYYVRSSLKAPGSAFQITATLTEAGSAITPNASGSFTFSSLTLGVPVDYTSSLGQYLILDQNGVIWAAGTSASPGQGVTVLNTSTTWTAITPHGTKLSANDSYSYANGVSIAIFFSYIMVLSDTQLLCFALSSAAWPSVTNADISPFKTFSYGSVPHKNFLGNDQILYITDAAQLDILQQKSGQVFDPTNAATYNWVAGNYLLTPIDVATRVATIPNGNGLSIVVGGRQNNLYIYPTYQQQAGASAIGPTTLLWIPEANTQYLVQANNYIIVFAGNKGNIYLTNGSTVTPLLTIPDYIAGSANFVQDPYFTWGGATYLRGRIFFSIQDSTASHTGNCGGVWSFTPSFSYFPQQDAGLSLRLEAASSLYSTQGYNGSAPVVFAGIDFMSQAANGPQYVAAWSQTTASTTVNSIDFSNTTPRTDGSSLIESDAVPVGTFLEKTSFKEIELQFAAPLVSGESVAVNYRTSLEDAWATAGTPITETTVSPDGAAIAQIIQGLNFEKVQMLQLQILLTSTVTNPSWCRLKDVYIR